MKRKAEAVAEIAAGLTSANKELKKIMNEGLDNRANANETTEEAADAAGAAAPSPPISSLKDGRAFKNGCFGTDGTAGKPKRIARHEAETLPLKETSGQ